jgi:hypothetical protein
MLGSGGSVVGRHRPGAVGVEWGPDATYPRQQGPVAGRARPVPAWAVADRWRAGSYRLTVWSCRAGSAVELQVRDRAEAPVLVPDAARNRLDLAGWQLLGGWRRYGDGWQAPVRRAR